MEQWQKLTRRDFLRLSVCAATGAIATACMPGAPQVAEAEKPVDLESMVQEGIQLMKSGYV